MVASKDKGSVVRKVAVATPCESCNGSMIDPEGEWIWMGIKHDFCRKCQGSGRDLTNPPCMDCGASTSEQAATMCLCGGDRDHCHGCEIWPD